jgi:hypothetical protein
MFLIRYDYLDFLEMVYVPVQKCYYVRVAMKDVELMQNITYLQAALERDRATEVQISMKGYEEIKKLAQEKRQSCWARYFTSIFPRAAETCGGCPAHTHAFSYDESCTLHNRIPLYIEPKPVDERLDILMSFLKNMLIRREENEIWSVEKALQLACAVNNLGIKVLVLPEIPASGAEVFAGLVVDAEEFKVLAGKQPSLFASGVLCAFDNDMRCNQLIFQWAQVLEEMGMRVLYYCKETMWITSQVRPIRHLLNGNTVAFEEVLGVCMRVQE